MVVLHNNPLAGANNRPEREETVGFTRNQQRGGALMRTSTAWEMKRGDGLILHLAVVLGVMLGLAVDLDGILCGRKGRPRPIP